MTFFPVRLGPAPRLTLLCFLYFFLHFSVYLLSSSSSSENKNIGKEDALQSSAGWLACCLTDSPSTNRALGADRRSDEWLAGCGLRIANQAGLRRRAVPCCGVGSFSYFSQVDSRNRADGRLDEMADRSFRAFSTANGQAPSDDGVLCGSETAGRPAVSLVTNRHGRPLDNGY